MLHTLCSSQHNWGMVHFIHFCSINNSLNTATPQNLMAFLESLRSQQWGIKFSLGQYCISKAGLVNNLYKSKASVQYSTVDKMTSAVMYNPFKVEFDCWGFKFFQDVNRICVTVVSRKLWCLKEVHTDFWTAPQNVGSLWAHPLQESSGPYPQRGGRESHALLLAKQYISLLKSDLKMPFFLSFKQVYAHFCTALYIYGACLK